MSDRKFCSRHEYKTANIGGVNYCAHCIEEAFRAINIPIEDNKIIVKYLSPLSKGQIRGCWFCYEAKSKPFFGGILGKEISKIPRELFRENPSYLGSDSTEHFMCTECAEDLERKGIEFKAVN